MNTIQFPPSTSEDVVGYYLYIELYPTTVSYNSPKVDIGNSTTVDLTVIPGIDIGKTYNLGITAYDEVDNESSFSLLTNITIGDEEPEPTPTPEPEPELNWFQRLWQSIINWFRNFF